MCIPTTQNHPKTPWHRRNVLVVGLLVLLWCCSWAFSLRNIFELQVWRRMHAIQKLRQESQQNIFANNYLDYLTRRYFVYLPHVLGAIVWWNFYFLQLIPAVRHAYSHAIHRWLGRILLVTVVLQVVSGVGLAWMSSSAIIKIVSYCLALAVLVCVYYAGVNAKRRDIARHQYWVYRLVGYMQTISAQRFWMIVMFATLDDTSNLDDAQMWGIFENSFVLAILSAVLITEWYLAGHMSMFEPRSQGYRPIGT